MWATPCGLDQREAQKKKQGRSRIRPWAVGARPGPFTPSKPKENRMLTVLSQGYRLRRVRSGSLAFFGCAGLELTGFCHPEVSGKGPWSGWEMANDKGERFRGYRLRRVRSGSLAFFRLRRFSGRAFLKKGAQKLLRCFWVCLLQRQQHFPDDFTGSHGAHTALITGRLVRLRRRQSRWLSDTPASPLAAAGQS